MQKNECSLCFAEDSLHFVFVDFICENCQRKIGDISKGMYESSRCILIFYILIQATFMKKERTKLPLLVLDTLDIDQLNELAHFFSDITRYRPR